ncbi:MAG: rhomboid family intramembrane serine protease [Polyangiales bacterium]|nr:rhomboid family intramembrane serine protease [Myxococcales bacterium]
MSFAAPPITSLTRTLFVVLIAAFVVETVSSNWLGFPLPAWLALTTKPWSVLTPVQIFTHPFAMSPRRDGVVDLALTLLFLWWMLSPFEQRFGRRRAIELLAAATVVPGLAALVIALPFANPAPLAGSVGWGLATLSAFAFSLPRDATISLMGVLPMRAIHLVWFSVGFALLRFLTGDSDFVLFGSELAAVGVGYGFVRWMARPQGRRRKKPSRAPKRSNPFRVIDGGDEDPPKYLN